MKKLLTSMLTFALVLSCFAFVGCSNKIDPKLVSYEQAVEICDTIIGEINDIKTLIANGYAYPTDEAVLAATKVNDTDKSGFNIEYSNYKDYEFYGEANGHTLFSPKTLYPGAIGVFDSYERYVGFLNKDFKLNVSYKFVTNEGEEFFKVTTEENKVNIYTIRNAVCTRLVVELDFSNGISWKSLRSTHFSMNSSTGTQGYFHTIMDRSTDETRLLDRCATVAWRIHSTSGPNQMQLGIFDFEERTQKMLFEEGFVDPNTVEGVMQGLYNYASSIDYTSFSNVIDTANAVLIEVNEQ